MSYSDSLSPWVIYRLLPHCQRLLVARFRKRNDAKAYLIVVRRMIPGVPFEIVYEGSRGGTDGSDQLNSPTPDTSSVQKIGRGAAFGQESLDAEKSVVRMPRPYPYATPMVCSTES